MNISVCSWGHCRVCTDCMARVATMSTLSKQPQSPQTVDDRQMVMGEHTDYGSVVMLFNRLGGLHVLLPGRDEQWCCVKPLPGHVIIKLGGTMVKFTNRLLRSNIHRVTS